VVLQEVPLHTDVLSLLADQGILGVHNTFTGIVQWTF
jgi:hypothetical protein